MQLLRVTNIQRGCVYDGPGVRTTVFLKGCPLHCPWCCNPETISYEEQWFVDEEKCLTKQGISSKLCENCVRVHGSRSIHECPFGVSEQTSKDYSKEELLDELLKDKVLYKESNGGVTFSGGEPLLQAYALLPLLFRLKEKKINIAFETTLVAPKDKILSVLPYTDLFIVDLKLQPQMMLGNQSYLEEIKTKQIKVIKKEVKYRMVFVDEVIDAKDDVLKSLQYLNILEVEFLLCHNLGRNKYLRLYQNNTDFTANKEKLDMFVDTLREKGIRVNVLSI